MIVLHTWRQIYSLSQYYYRISFFFHLKSSSNVREWLEKCLTLCKVHATEVFTQVHFFHKTNFVEFFIKKCNY